MSVSRNNNDSTEMKVELVRKLFEAVDSTLNGDYEINAIRFVPHRGTESGQPGIKVVIDTTRAREADDASDFFNDENKELIHSGKLGVKLQEVCSAVRDSAPGTLFDSSTEDLELKVTGSDTRLQNWSCPRIEFELSRLPDEAE